MKHFKILIAFSILLFTQNLFAQNFEKSWQRLEKRIRAGEALSTQEKLDFIHIHSEELKKHPIENSILVNGLGQDALSIENYVDAISYLNQSIELAKTGKDSVYVALYQYELASLYNDVGYYEMAEPLFISALPTLSNYYGQSSLEYTKCFKQLTEMYVEMGRYNEAKLYNDALLYYFKTLYGEKNKEYLICLNNDARISQGNGDYNKALEVFKTILITIESTLPLDTLSYSTMLNNCAEIYRHLSDYDKAIEMQQKSVYLSQLSEGKNAISLATNFNNLGLCFKAIGDYQNSEKSFDQAIDIYKNLRLTFIPDYSTPLSNKADLFRILGRYEQAKFLLQQVIQIRAASLGTKHVNYANSLSNLALLYNDVELYDDAKKLLTQALEIYHETLGDYHPFTANCINNLSNLNFHLGNYKEAEQNKLKALEIMKQMVGEKHLNYALYLRGLATIYDRQKKTKQAIQVLEESNRIVRDKYGNKNKDLIDGEFNLAYFEVKNKNFSKAKELYTKTLIEYQNQMDNYFSAMSENDQLDYYNAMYIRLGTFNTFLKQFVDANSKADYSDLTKTAFNNQLFLRSILLNNSIQTRKKIANSSDTSLIRLYEEYLSVKHKLLQLSKDPELIASSYKVEELSAIENKLESQIKNKINLFASPRSDYKEIQSRLKVDEAAIFIIKDTYLKNDTLNSINYFALLLKQNSIAPELILLNESDNFETDYYEYYKERINNKLEDKLSYLRFWKKIEDKLNGIQHLYLCPDGIYNQINLYSLYNPNSNKFLLDRYTISILPNLTFLLNPLKETNPDKTADLYGYPDYEFDFKTQKSDIISSSPFAKNRFGFTELSPLPGTQVEVNNISNSLQEHGWKVNLYTKSRASEHQLKRTNSPKILHIATHGYFLDDILESDDKTILGFESNTLRRNPLLQSGILMAGASVAARDTSNSEKLLDGIFTAYEASLLDLDKTDLVVLSACETGLGANSLGQGVYGLQRAFYIAGAKYLIMSLWAVDDDATQLLMSEFYKNWVPDSSLDKIHSCFKNAQIEVRKKYPHPYYWSAFVLLGN